MKGEREPVDGTDRVIGYRLLAHRRLIGLPLEAVAKAASVLPCELAAIEAGESKVYVSTLWRLCRALDAELDEIMPSPDQCMVAGHA